MEHATTLGKRWIAALLAVWVVTATAATEISGADWRDAGLVVALGAVAAMTAARRLTLWRAVTMAVVPVAALVDPAALLPWSMAGASVALGFAPRAPVSELADGQAVQKHLMLCRRRDERADVMVVRLEQPSRPRLHKLLEGTRVTDSLAVRRHAGGIEIYGLLDAAGVDRSVVEERLKHLVGGPVSVGWATFPEDGYTMQALVEEARRGIQPEDSNEPVSFPRWPRTPLRAAPAMESDATRMVGR